MDVVMLADWTRRDAGGGYVPLARQDVALRPDR
jgi:hypothetical protein